MFGITVLRLDRYFDESGRLFKRGIIYRRGGETFIRERERLDEHTTLTLSAPLTDDDVSTLRAGGFID